MRRAVLALAMVSALAIPVAADAGRCPLVVDDPGDATGSYIAMWPFNALPVRSVPAGDILSADVVTTRAGMTVVIRTATLPGPDDDSPTGYLYEMQMDLREHRVAFSAIDNVDGERFQINLVSTASPAYRHPGISGRFDRAAKEARVSATWDALRTLAGESVQDQSASGFSLSSHRYLGADLVGGVTPLLDTAQSSRVHRPRDRSCAAA